MISGSKRTGEVGSLKGWQLAALREMMGNSTVYTQRVLEEVAFPNPDAQHWRRTLQLRIPDWDSFAKGQRPPDGELKFIVPLGVFIRARLPDLTVRDGQGRACPLVTRAQHGYSMSMITLHQFLEHDQQKRLREADWGDELSALGREAMEALFAMFTTLPGDRRVPTAEQPELPSSRQLTDRAVLALDMLMYALGTPDTERQRAQSLYSRDFHALQRFTQYLCLVETRPGATVNLTVTYTIASNHQLSTKQARLEAERSERSSRTPAATGLGRWILAGFLRFRTWIYEGTGLSPVAYEAFATATGRSGSFYFTIDPPPDTELSYLGWASGNSIEDEQEKLSWLCSLPSTHEHHGTRLGAGMADALASDMDRHFEPQPEDDPGPSRDSGAPENTVLACMRPVPPNQMQIALAAGMNLVLAFLALSNRLTSDLDPSAASLLLLTPAVVVAYITYQGRHHYAARTRVLRAALWIYIVINAFFLLAVVFDVTENSTGADSVFNHRTAAVLLAGASAGLAVMFLLIGGRYEWLVKRKFKRRRRKIDRKVLATANPPGWTREPKARTFSRMATRSSDVIGGLAFATTVVMTTIAIVAPNWLAVVGLGGEEEKHRPPEVKRARTQLLAAPRERAPGR
jgi:hypothetical protein